MNALTAVIIALAISLAGNAGLSYLWLGARDEATTAQTNLKSAKDAAETCSKSVDDLQVKAADRAKAAAKDRAAAAASAQNRDAKADEILSTPATSTDDCKAAQDRVTAWLKGRK